MTAILYESVCKRFHSSERPAVDHVNAEIMSGEFITILGSSGCGKTTLLKLTNRLQDPDRIPVGRKVISIMGEMGRDFDGGYAEYVLLPNRQIYTVDTDLSWDILASIPETFYTAFGSMKNLRIQKEDRILVRGATSGVGIAFLKLIKAKNPDTYVAGSTRSNAKEQKLRETGFDSVIIEKDGVLQTDETFDKVFELIGPATLMDTFAHTTEGGIVCSTGQLGGKWYMNDFDPITGLPANGYLTSFYSGNVDSGKLQEMLDYIERYHVDVKPEKVFRLQEVPDAHSYLESSHSFGKVVVVNDEAGDILKN